MKRRKIDWWWLIWVFCANEMMVDYCSCGVSSSPSSSPDNNLAITHFQNAVQQQNTISILSSIEERLRNLDNIYSMQLTHNFESKLDQYNRKLENLDGKVMRLEAIVMLNLGKISENISTKNYKDDMTKTYIMRKLDSIYEGVTHRMSYIESKLESNHVLIQQKLDETSTQMDKLEKGATKRDSDLETELSAVISAIDDLKKTHKTSEQKVRNMTEETLNISKHTFTLLTKSNVDTRKAMNKLHDNLVGNLQYLDNRTTQHMKISDDTNTILKQMRIELKEDFNNYANKVADMNSDMWKNTDTTEDDLKNIGLVLNSTKSELQNGIRSLMIQIGQLAFKKNFTDSDRDYKELENKIATMLTNQDVFLESCHRLQMDESQIESEISVMLNKLLDMLEKKLSSEVKDIKNFEKNLKNHDNRINRNILQANQNIISLFEKSTMNTQMLTTEIRKVGTDLNALFSLVQSTINDGSSPTSMVTSKEFLDKLSTIERSTTIMRNLMSTFKLENVSNHHIHKEIQKMSKSILTAIERFRNDTRDFRYDQKTSIQKIESILKQRKEKIPTPPTVPSTLKPEINDTVREHVARVFGENPNLNKPKQKKKCGSNIRNLIDIRAGDNSDCDGQSQKPKKPRRRKLKYDIDIRGDLGTNNTEEDYDEEYDDTTLTTNPTTASLFLETTTSDGVVTTEPQETLNATQENVSG